MNLKEYEKLYNLQETYWWFKGKKYLIHKIIRNINYDNQDLKILDVGCGPGNITKSLFQYGHVTGLDMADIALEFCKKNGIVSLKKGSVSEIPYLDKSFDLVCAIDILYHRGVVDDEKAISEIYRVLKPGGRAIITTSAMKCLFGKNDIVQHGARRHSKKEILNKCIKTGFIPETVSYYTFAFFPLVYIVRKIQDLRRSEPTSDIDENINPGINTICYLWFKFEIDLLKYITYPFGVHLYGLFRRPLEFK